MLCETCERRFSVAENEFAKRLFLPYNEGQVTFEYDHWLLYFAVSLAWRCAATSRREELEKYPQHVQPVDDARQRWGEFLLNDVDALTPYRFNLFFTPAGVQWKTRIPEPLSWYFLRAVDITPVYSRSKVAMYVKFPGMFFWTCVVPPDSGAWRGTRIAKHGTFRAKNQVLSDERAGTFLIERAETVRKRFVAQRLGIDKIGVPSGTVDRVAKRVLDANPLTGLGYVAVDRSLTPAKRPTPRTVTVKRPTPRTVTAKGTRKVGRPPAGLRPGERVSDYQRFTLWIPPDVKADLDRVSRLLGRPQWAVVVEALTAFQTALPAAARKALDVMKRR